MPAVPPDVIEGLGALRETTVELRTGVDTGQYGINGLVPHAVAYPTTSEEVVRVMEEVSLQNMAVAPWGGGTRTSLGNAPERLDAVINLSRLDRPIEHNPADLTASFEAGITITRLQELLGEHGQFLPIDPPLPDRATLGGTLASGAVGPLKWMYGSTRDLVIGMSVVQADGKLIKSGGRVVKNVSGYDMARLHIGGLGSLGIIVEVSLKLTPLPAGQATIISSYQNAQKALEAGLGVFRSDAVPLAIATFDAAVNDRIEASDLTGGSFLAIRVGGRPLTLERQIKECRWVCNEHGPLRLDVLSDADGAALWRRLADLGWDEGSAPLIGTRTHVPPSRIMELAENLGKTGMDEGLQPAIATHPAHGAVLAHWYAPDARPSMDAFTGVISSAREAAHHLEGRMVIEQCPADVRPGIDVWDDVGEPISIMRRLKEQYDPRRLLNPGRFVGGI